MNKALKLIVAASVLASALPAGAQQVPEIAYDAVTNFLSLPNYGEVAGVATNSQGHIFVYARTGYPVATLGHERTFLHGGSKLFQFDATGKFVKEIGQDTYSMNFAQQVRVDPQGNVWAVDSGSNMIMKFGPDGGFLQPYGRRPEAINVRPGPGVPARTVDGPGHPPNPPAAPAANAPPPGTGFPGQSFDRVSDVAFDAAGNAYVADGWGANNRVSKFSKDGNFVKSFGHTGSGPGQFSNIRGIAMDTAGNLYVADAGNNRIQVLNAEGTFKSEIKGIGKPMAICISPGATQYLFSSNSNDPETLDNGEIYKLQLDGKIVGKFGKAGKIAKEFSVVNALDCRTENDLLVGEIGNWRVSKVTLRK